MRKMVSINVLESAFDEVLSVIDQIEETVESQTEIEINEMQIAQAEKIVYVLSQLNKVESIKKIKPYPTPLTLAISR